MLAVQECVDFLFLIRTMIEERERERKRDGFKFSIYISH